MRYFVTAIGTDSGKTLVSAILTEALQADYWKPVQCGDLDRDYDKVSSLILNGHSICHEEAVLLPLPMSPHAAAAAAGVELLIDTIKLPQNIGENLVIEGAGGILVPLNEKEFIIDLAEKFDAEVVLVCNHYLGGINHALLSIQELKRRNINVKGIIFNGEANTASEEIILSVSGYRCLLRILPEPEITQEVIMKYAVQLFDNWDA